MCFQNKYVPRTLTLLPQLLLKISYPSCVPSRDPDSPVQSSYSLSLAFLWFSSVPLCDVLFLFLKLNMLPQIFDEIAANRGFGRERAAQGEQIAAVKPVRKLLDGADVDNEITVTAYKLLGV